MIEGSKVTIDPKQLAKDKDLQKNHLASYLKEMDQNSPEYHAFSHMERMLDKIYNELLIIRTILVQERLDRLVDEMREATLEERKNSDDYIKSISKETGINFNNEVK